MVSDGARRTRTPPAICFDMGEPITAHFVVTHVDKKPLNLWYAYPDDLLAEGVEEACAALLSEEERARAAKFKFARHARESLTSHALARTALSSKVEQRSLT